MFIIQLALAIIFIQKIYSQDETSSRTLYFADDEGVPIVSKSAEVERSKPPDTFSETTVDEYAASSVLVIGDQNDNDNAGDGDGRGIFQSSEKSETLYLPPPTTDISSLRKQGSDNIGAEDQDMFDKSNENPETGIYFPPVNTTEMETLLGDKDEVSPDGGDIFGDNMQSNTPDDKDIFGDDMQSNTPNDRDIFDENSEKSTTIYFPESESNKNIGRMGLEHSASDNEGATGNVNEAKNALRDQQVFDVNWPGIDAGEPLYIPFQGNSNENEQLDTRSTTTSYNSAIDANKLFENKYSTQTVGGGNKRQTTKFVKITGSTLDANEFFNKKYGARKRFIAETAVSDEVQQQKVPAEFKVIRKTNIRRLNEIWNWDYWCQLQPKRGRCDSTSLRYYYDSQLDQCRTFPYTGCEGNKNNFKTAVDCLQHCKGAAFMTVKDAERKSPCDLQPSAGLCLGLLPKFYFDVNERTCKSFMYGGCGGNHNRFDNLGDCQSKCSD